MQRRTVPIRRRTVGFPAATRRITTESFLVDFAEHVVSESAGRLGAWLMKNAASMSEAMFFGSKINWSKLKPAVMFVIRACAPSGVFTPASRAGYLTNVAENPELSLITDMLFSDDVGFLNKLRSAYPEFLTTVVRLMQQAYQKKIRPAIREIREM